MRSLALAALALVAGCDVLFGLEREGGSDATLPDPDALASDGKPGAIISDLRLVNRVNVNGTVEVRARVAQDPGNALMWELTASAGDFVQRTGTVALDSSGVGDITAIYRAPATEQTVTITLAVLGELAMLMEPVRPVTIYGFDQNGTGDLTIGASSAFGIRVAIMNGGWLDSLGLRAGDDGGQVKMALYTDVNNAPGQKVADTAMKPVLQGRNTYAVTPVPISSGTYWVLALFDKTTQVRSNAAASYVLGAELFASGFPPSYSTTSFTVTMGSTPMMFVTVGAN
jgi:hypothetical protein